jgi:L-fuconolactonase
MYTSPRNDAHIHLFNAGFTPQSNPMDEFATYEQIRQASGIAQALVVGYEGDSRFAGNNGEILALSKEHGWIQPLAFLESGTEWKPAELHKLRDAGFVGFSLYLNETEPGIETWPAERLAALADRGSIISLNASPGALAKMVDVMSHLTEGAVIVSHAGSPGTESAFASIKEVEQRLHPLIELARHPHVFVKISGLYAIDPHYPHLGARQVVRVLRERFGASRLVWGSDFSPALQYVTQDELISIPEWWRDVFTSEELSGVLCQNLSGILSRMRRRSAMPDLSDNYLSEES